MSAHIVNSVRDWTETLCGLKREEYELGPRGLEHPERGVLNIVSPGTASRRMGNRQPVCMDCWGKLAVDQKNPVPEVADAPVPQVREPALFRAKVPETIEVFVHRGMIGLRFPDTKAAHHVGSLLSKMAEGYTVLTFAPEGVEKDHLDAFTTLVKGYEEPEAPERGEPQTCPSRIHGVGPWEKREGIDSWDKRGPDRVCSFCGSMHPDDFETVMGAAACPDTDVTIELATGGKRKVYIRRPGVKNASEGAIKFYLAHLDGVEPNEEKEALFNQALRESRRKFDRKLSRKSP